jgi:hypothetical protein
MTRFCFSQLTDETIHPHVHTESETLWHDPTEMPTSLTMDCDAPVFMNTFSDSHLNLSLFFFIDAHLEHLASLLLLNF